MRLLGYPFTLLPRVQLCSLVPSALPNPHHTCQRLNVESNLLTQLPAWLGKCSTLEQLTVSHNPLATIPVCRNSWRGLVDLVCSDCEFGPVGLLNLWRDLDDQQDMLSSHTPLYKQVRSDTHTQTLTEK